MDKKIVVSDYKIENGVFYGKLITFTGVRDFQEMKWKEERTGLECKASVKCQWDERQGGCLNVVTDFMREDYAIRTWRLILVLKDGREYPVFYGEEIAESYFGKMLSLAKTEVVANRHIHLIPAIDKDGAFAIRKWRTKSEAIKTKPTYIERINRFGTTLEVELEKPYAKEVKEAEIFIWSRSLKHLVRIPVSVKDVNKGKFSFDMRKFVEEHGGKLHKLWEALLVMNMEGSYYLSRMEDKGNREWEKKRLEAEKEGKEFVTPYKPKKLDDGERFFGGIPYIHKDGGSYQIETENPEQTDCLLMPYYTEEMQFACKFVKRRNFYVTQFRERMLDVKIKNGICQITTLSVHEDISYHDLVIRYRDQNSSTSDEASDANATNDAEPEDDHETPFCFEDDVFFQMVSSKKTKKGIRQVWRLSLDAIPFQQYLWDLFLIGERKGYDYEIRPINPDGKRFLRKIYRGFGNVYKDANGQIVFPFLTENENVVLFCRQEGKYDALSYVRNERLALLWYRCFWWYYNRKKIILLYEKHGMMAQDNSYTMFLYLTSEKVKKEVRNGSFYVIDKSQPDYAKLKGYGKKVLQFMSVRHLIYLQAATLFVSIDSKRHAYAWRSRNSKILDVMKEKPFLFLQHGVIGFKRVDYIYKKGGINSANHIVVASEREKRIAMKWFGYGEDEVIIAGMARWEGMKDKSSGSRDLLLMPTWRNWLQEVTEEVFVESDYYKHYYELLNEKELEDFLETYDLRLIFCMHPKFREFMGRFQVKSNRIKLFSYDTKPIKDLIMECRLLITDYSSVSWDVYYLKKPIIFYQFDYNKYMEWQGGYYDMEKELFGPRVINKEDLITEMKRYCENGFQEDKKYSDMRKTCLPSESGCICKKIYEEIEKRYFD